MEPLVSIEHLSKRFGALLAVDDVSFAVQRGEVLGFLGPNGAGKSTTMKMVTGFLEPDGGRVRVAGLDIAEHPIAVKRRIGYLPEGAPLYGDMTAGAFLRFIAEVRGFRGEERRRRVQAAVAKVHLESVLEKPIDTLSKGYKRRVGLAQAILHDPEILVLDEPTDGLDPNQKHEVRALIRAMAPEKAIVLSTHILEEVDAVCTRAVIIAAGRVVSDGTPAQLARRAPGHNAVSFALPGLRADAARDLLAALPGVAAVEVLEDDAARVRFQVRPVDGAPIAERVGSLARAHGWTLEDLHVERGRLEEVFRAVTVPAARRAE